MMNPAAARVLDSSFGGASGGGGGGQGYNMNAPFPVYPGLEKLHQECCRVYPTQPNPLQLKSRVKFWAGGPDPLDYVSIYSHPGNADEEIPPHWHYVSFGISDLYGDGRLFPLNYELNPNSGFGFELTFRLKKDTVNPPVWPGVLLQKLAIYTFKSGNPFLHGDHVSWHRSLDENDESRLQHMLVAADPELREVDGPFGKVKFIQIVGATIEELEAAQNWNGPSFLELMKENQECGGRYLVTDLRRGESLFELDPSVQEKVADGIMNDGSNLSGVTATVSWSADVLPLRKDVRSDRVIPEGQRRPSSGLSDNDLKNLLDVAAASSLHGFSGPNDDPPFSLDDLSDDLEQLSKLDLGSDFGEPTAGCSKASTSTGFHLNSMTTSKPQNENQNLTTANQGDFASFTQDVSMSLESNNSIQGQSLVNELDDETEVHETIHVTLNLEAALLIPLVVKGRIRHGRHFTFKSQNNDCAVTIVAPYVAGSYADMTNKFASRTKWLQICLDEELAGKLLDDFDELKKLQMVAFPTTIYSIGNKFALTVTL